MKNNVILYTFTCFYLLSFMNYWIKKTSNIEKCMTLRYLSKSDYFTFKMYILHHVMFYISWNVAIYMKYIFVFSIAVFYHSPSILFWFLYILEKCYIRMISGLFIRFLNCNYILSFLKCIDNQPSMRLNCIDNSHMIKSFRPKKLWEKEKAIFTLSFAFTFSIKKALRDTCMDVQFKNIFVVVAFFFFNLFLLLFL